MNSRNGICKLKNARDGLALRCVGDWAKEKYDYLRRYIDIFETSMKNKWRERNFIDLFAGPGICMTRGLEEEIPGSPMLGIQCPHPFTGYFFIDKNSVCIDSLKIRCRNTSLFDKIRFFEEDCNLVVKDITGQIHERSLNLAFIDPTGLDIGFLTIKKLTENKRIDVIINFPIGTSINRNWEKLISKEGSKLDEFMGSDGWRDYYKKTVIQGDESIARALLSYYRKKLESIGYMSLRIGTEKLVRSSTKNLPLYYLIFASKSRLGHEFWKKLGLVEPYGQRTFDFSI
jgi:three-Cys-motif partner protein